MVARGAGAEAGAMSDLTWFELTAALIVAMVVLAALSARILARAERDDEVSAPRR